MPPPWQLTQAEILTLISHLVRRPARSSHRLPLIWLSGQDNGKPVLDALVTRLRAPRRYLVPRARPDSVTSEGPADDIRPLLHELCVQLGKPKFGGEQLRFRHYELAESLMALDFSRLGSEDRVKKIVTFLRRRHRLSRSHDKNQGDDKIDFGSKYQLVIWLIQRLAPRVLFHAAISGKIPGFGRLYRWFMGQCYLAPPQSVNFLGFAERLTKGVREPEDSDQIDKLLVHAFLQDLRQAYRRRLGRIEGWRRTAYPVVLIDNVTPGSAGYRLLRLIGEVRNETGQRDPLLVVCSSDEVPQAPTLLPGVAPASGIRRNNDPVYGNTVYRNWAEALPGSHRARKVTAWDLPISVTHRDDESDPPPVKEIGARRPPWFARRSVAATVVGMLILSGIAAVSWWYGGGLGCPHLPFRGHVDVVSMGGECVGYSDSSDYRFNDQPGQERLRDIQDKIFEQNRAARGQWEQGKRTRPYVTLVYLSVLTGRSANPTEEVYPAEREELEGLAVAQYDSITKSATSSTPFLNIVIANAGQEMKNVSTVVDMIGHLATKDPTVVGVIGFDESRDTTAKAIQKLNEIGLLVIPTTLAADNLGKDSQFYLPISAQNRDEARMIAEYSRRALRASGTRLYWTTGAQLNFTEDLYVNTLVDDLKKELGKSGITVDTVAEFKRSPIEGVCSYQGVVVFAGRWNKFSKFLNALGECRDVRPLQVIADDSVSRYMASRKQREDAPVAISVTYVSKSLLITCEHLRDASKRRDGPTDKFFQLTRETGLFESQNCTQGNEPISERIPIAYDAARLVLQAIEGVDQDLRPDSAQAWDPRSTSPVAMYLKILQQIRKKPYEGITGTIKFSDDPGGAINRKISLVRVTNLRDPNAQPEEVYYCGFIRGKDNSVPPCRKP